MQTLSTSPSEMDGALGVMGSKLSMSGWVLDRAVAASPNGVVVTDPSLPDSPIVFANPAFLQMTGYSMDEVIGRNCRFLQNDDQDQEELEGLRQAIVEERSHRAVLQNYRKDGTLFWNELYISPVHDDEGCLTNYLGIQNDITARQVAELKLQESEERYRSTFDRAAVGVAQVGLDGRWLWANEKLQETLGYTEEELLETDFQRITASEDLEANLEGMRRMLRGESETFSTEKRYIRKDGDEDAWTLLTVSLVREASGEPQHFIAVLKDISERRKAEAERDLLLGREQRASTEADTARRRLSLLASAGPILAASLDYEATLERITRLVVPDLADWCSVDIVDERGVPQQLAATHSKPDKEELMREFQRHRRLTEGSPGTVATVLSTGRSMLIPEIEDSLLERSATSDEHLRALRSLEMRSMMSVPLRARGRTLGALTFASSNPERQYDEDDLELAENLAYRCAIAVDNARLYRDRDEISRTLQRSLLPPLLPEITGVEVGTEYQPAGEANEVGGDFYDVIDTARDSWVCTIGDVCGKGAEAAAVMALVRYTIRAVTLANDQPKHLLDTLNTAMIQQLKEDRFCTAACLRLDLHDDRPGIDVEVSCAGHPAPLILRADGSLEEVFCPGKALGVFEDPSLGQTSLRLLPGDAILLYTDGVIEARSPDGGFFGKDRLRSLLRSHQNENAATLAANIKEEVSTFQEHAARDDLAIMVLRAAE